MAGREVPLTTKLAGAAEAIVKRRVQAKLEHYLPAATDSVLCDYVLVMVGNKKTSRQVALDLEAFLGPDEAEEFVTWLWELLSSVENGTLDLSGEAAPPAAAPAAEPKREERRSRSPPRRDDRRRSRSREGARSKNYSSHARSRSRSRERGGDRRHDDGRRGGRMGQDARRRDEYDDRDWGYNRGGRQGQGGGGGGGVPADDRRGLRAPTMTSRLLMEAVKSQGQGPRSAARGAEGFQKDEVHSEEVPQHGPGRMRSDTILEETKKHLLHRQQQELQERKAQMQQQQAPAPRAVGGFGSLASSDLRNLLSKNRGGTGQRPAGFGGSGGISARLGPIGGAAAAAADTTKQEEKEEPEEKATAEAQEDEEEDVAFNVTMPVSALTAPSGDGEMEEGEEGYEEGYEEGGWEEGADSAEGYYTGYRGGGPVETFAAKKWVNPALAAASGSGGVAAAAAGGAAVTTGTSAEGGSGGAGTGAKTAGAEGGKPHRPVVGKLNLDGSLDGVGKRGLYKAAKWVKAS